MKKVIKDILSQEAINFFYHLPKAILANIVYGFPSKKLTVIGVTGTDGKTTTVNMIYQILRAAGKKVSMVSTINAVVGGKTKDIGFHVTSPTPFSIQKLTRQSVNNGDEYFVLEVTSHAIDQYRFWGINFAVGVITNVTHEHLDYHKTFENYLKTKLKLIQKAKFAVVNQAVGNVREIGKKIITFGLDKGDFNQKELKLKLKVPGDYNIENALAAFGVAFALEIDKNVAQKALENFVGISGRMEEVKNYKGIKIIIDFAHTPNGLEQALETLRSKTSGRLIAVIGAEGDRDIGKRAMMGEVAKRLANFLVITAVDPRGELSIINRQITEGAKKAGAVEDRNLFIINDREEAINFAVNKLSKKGDTVGIFGKGHESSMNLDGKREVPWSDKEAVERCLEGSSFGRKNRKIPYGF